MPGFLESMMGGRVILGLRSGHHSKLLPLLRTSDECFSVTSLLLNIVGQKTTATAAVVQDIDRNMWL